MFSCEICEIFKNIYFEGHLQRTASRFPDIFKKYRERPAAYNELRRQQPSVQSYRIKLAFKFRNPQIRCFFSKFQSLHQHFTAYKDQISIFSILLLTSFLLRCYFCKTALYLLSLKIP